MILSGHQPNYLPYPGLIGKIMLSDKFIYVTKVQFEKKSWQNRNRIRTCEGWIWLTVPTLTKGKFTQNICEVEINNDEDWRKKHMRAIELNYGKAPFFKEYHDFLKDLYSKDWLYLSELDIYFMNFILKELDIKTEILYDKDYCFEGNKTDLLTDMTRQCGCDTYLSNSGSSAYVDINTFIDNGMNHIFMEYIGEGYRQQYAGFETNTSIIDMLFNCGRSGTKAILSSKNNYRISAVNNNLN